MTRAIDRRLAFALMALAGWFLSLMAVLTAPFPGLIEGAWLMGFVSVGFLAAASWPLAASRPRPWVLRGWRWAMAAWLVPLAFLVAMVLFVFDPAPSAAKTLEPLLMIATRLLLTSFFWMPLAVLALALSARPACQPVAQDEFFVAA